MERRRAPPSSHPIGHWILFLARLGHGADSFSLESLRALSLQTSIVPFEEIEEHPSHPEISPLADSELLTRLARNEHVLGGRAHFQSGLRHFPDNQLMRETAQ